MQSLLRTCAAVAAVGFGLAVTAGTQSGGQGQSRQGEWRHYSGDNGAKKYAPLDQINRANVTQLRIAWRRPQVSANSSRPIPNCASRTITGRRRSW